MYLHESSMFDWIRNFLFRWGLWSKTAKILFLGLDNSGKTTLLHVMKNHLVTTSPPTIHPLQEQLIVNNVTFNAFDLGGHIQARRLWKDYFPEVDAIVYIIDTSDDERFLESKAELNALLMIEELADTPVAVLGNKIDLNTAVSEEHLRYVFNLQNTSGYDAYRAKNSGQRPIELFMCSIIYQQGFGTAFQWLSDLL